MSQQKDSARDRNDFVSTGFASPVSSKEQAYNSGAYNSGSTTGNNSKIIKQHASSLPPVKREIKVGGLGKFQIKKHGAQAAQDKGRNAGVRFSELLGRTTLFQK